jgi:hypothetical protein
VATQAWNCHVGEPFDFTFNFPGDFVPDAHTVALGCDLTGAPSIGTITITP